jgi:hypothetical protein
VSGGSCTRLSDAAGGVPAERVALGCSATDTVSRDARNRTMCVGFGDRLLTQEHVSVREGESPAEPSALGSADTSPSRCCPGRTRTCTRPVNSGPHHRCATGHQFRGLDSNQHRRVQGPPPYQLGDPGIDPVAEEGVEPSRPFRGSSF